MDLLNLRLEIIKKQVEDVVNQVKSLIQNPTEDKQVDIQYLSKLLKMKTERYISETHIYIEKVTPNQAVDEITAHTELQLEAERLLVQLQNYTKEPNMANLNSNCTNPVNVTTKLPKLELIKFKGEVLRWHEFWDRFCSSVHSKHIRDVDKLTYLQACLEGGAKETIEGLETTDANYDIAVTTLKNRFGKKTLVIDAHYREIYRIQRKDNSTRECRKLLNELERNLRVLQSLGENVDGAHFRFLLYEKFPEDIIREIKLKITDDESVNTIRKHLEHVISSRESVNRSSSPITPAFSTDVLHIRNKEDKMKDPLKGRHFKTYTRQPFRSNIQNYKPYSTDNKPYKRKSNFHQNSFQNAKKPRMSCIFCGGEHFNDECSVVNTLEERKKKLVNRCFICLRNNHRANDCKTTKKCAYCNSINKHNRALCPQRNKGSTSATTTLHINKENDNSRTLLETAIVKVYTETGEEINCRILLDNGSQRSYVTKTFADILGLKPVENTHLLVYTFGSNKPRDTKSYLTNLTLITKRQTKRTIQVNIVPFITNGVMGTKLSLEKNLLLADDNSEGDRIDVLIGNDYYQQLIRNDRIKLKDNLFLIDSDFGWLISGRIPQSKQKQTMSFLTYFQSNQSEDLHFHAPDLPLQDNGIQQLWELDAIGIKEPPKSTNEEEAVRLFNSSTKYDKETNRYIVKWPWVTYPPNLPINYGLALGRLQSLIKRTDRNVLVKYNEIIEQQEKLGIIEKVKDYKTTQDHPIHYLPHHHVVKEGGTTAIRIVYDGSAKPSGMYNSLNELLYKGPLLLEDLTGLLLRFRQFKLGIVADIEKAFLQLGLFEEDKDVTRFLWANDYNKDLTEENLICYRFCRVPFGVISSPFLLNAVIKYHLSTYKNETLDRVKRNIYVDNLVMSTKTESEANQLYEQSKRAFEDISMNIRLWNSNSPDFGKNLKLDQYDNREIVSVLGYEWNKKNDTMKLKIKDKKFERKEENLTKRKVISTAASIFDPCGFTQPSLLKAKVYIQNLWIDKYKWDTTIPKERAEEWYNILESLRKVQELELPRYVGINNKNNPIKYELHCFADASLQAYAAVVYVKVIYTNDVKVSFLMAKTRLNSPKKQKEIKIPQLELLACVIGTRLLSYIKHSLELEINNQYLWSDSQIAISWLKSEKLLPPFVQKQVNEIRKLDRLQILYINTENNPADIATRTKTHGKENEWILGPKFLHTQHTYKDNWSFTQNYVVGEGLIESIIEDKESPTEQENSNKDVQESEISNPKRKQNNEGQKEINNEINIIKTLQQQNFPEEYAGKQTNLSRSLSLFKDNEGLLRCKGRISYAAWSYDEKFPILLPKKSEYTEKVTMKYHKDNYHVGATHTLSLVRQRYWIPQGRAKVTSILKKCPECKKHGGGPYKLPNLAPLPQERLDCHKAFSYTGLDYLGPLLITNESGVTEKRWICLYTCLAVRAVHLEVVKDLTAEECLLALRRFIATRGIPKLILSDNAPQFILTANVVKSKFCIERKIEWKFIPELAPWHGGVYERLVALVKHCLKRTVDKHHMNDTELNTIIKEIESVLNTRPLTYVGTEQEYILKPVDFLCLNDCIILSSDEPYLNTRDTSTKTALIEGWKRGRMIIDEFAKMFVNQYLPDLRNRKQTSHKQHRIVTNQIPKVGDFVQMKGDSNNRSLWNTGKIISLTKSKDGEIRVARVRIGNQEFTRSIGHLYPLEITEENKESDDSINNKDKGEQDEVSNEVEKETQRKSLHEKDDETLNIPDKKGGRVAAKLAKEKLKRWTKMLSD